jgi:hypothetical protein
MASSRALLDLFQSLGSSFPFLVLVQVSMVSIVTKLSAEPRLEGKSARSSYLLKMLAVSSISNVAASGGPFQLKCESGGGF